MLKWIIIIIFILYLIFLFKRIWLLFYSKRHAYLKREFNDIENKLHRTLEEASSLLIGQWADKDEVDKAINDIDSQIVCLDKFMARQFEERVPYLFNPKVEVYLKQLYEIRANLMRRRGAILLHQLKIGILR